jgi:hypothetical protein
MWSQLGKILRLAVSIAQRDERHVSYCRFGMADGVADRLLGKTEQLILDSRWQTSSGLGWKELGATWKKPGFSLGEDASGRGRKLVRCNGVFVHG